MNNPALIGLEEFVPAEVKPFERAARIYLAMRGDNPYDHIPQAHPRLEGVVVKVPVWCFAAGELIDLSFKLSALKKASEPENVVVKA